MTRNLTFWIVSCDFKKMLRETHFQLTFGLPNILYSATLARNAVDQIGASATHNKSAHVGSTGCGKSILPSVSSLGQYRHVFGRKHMLEDSTLSVSVCLIFALTR